MALNPFRVQNVATRSELRRINAMHLVHKNKPDSRALDAGIHVLMAEQYQKTWMAGTSPRLSGLSFKSTVGPFDLY
jgi:hypothetical protein